MYNPVELAGDASAQEVFEGVVKHLFKQGKQSLMKAPERAETTSDDGMICAYRGGDGTMCAAGCLIPNDVYVPEMENLNVTTLIIDGHSKVLPAYFVNHNLLLSQLQSLHDTKNNWSSVELFRECATKLGQRYRLETDFIKELSFNN